MEGDKEKGDVESPTNSLQTVSDDDEIDYSVKPEFYDSDLDDKDESWMHKRRGGRTSDAVLSCPGCFTTVCLECQRHEKYVTQYRAVFVVNCSLGKDRTIQETAASRGGKRRRDSGESEAGTASSLSQTYKQVCCSVCSTEIGVMDDDEIYHFFNVIPSEC